MIRDFYQMEQYFGRYEAVRSLNETIKHYGAGIVTQAIRNGLLDIAPIHYCGFRSQSHVWLSEKGRSLAAQTKPFRHAA